jgi:hypothetical protein
MEYLLGHGMGLKLHTNIRKWLKSYAMDIKMHANLRVSKALLVNSKFQFPYPLCSQIEIQI